VKPPVAGETEGKRGVSGGGSLFQEHPPMGKNDKVFCWKKKKVELTAEEAKTKARVLEGARKIWLEGACKAQKKSHLDVLGEGKSPPRLKHFPRRGNRG